MIRPTITVIIPNYNNILYFPKAYKSVKNQTKAPHEIIIICDETNIKAFQFIKNITKGDKRTIVIQNKKNRGVSYSRNLGIKKAKGDYIAFLDSDDVWDKRKLEFQLRLMRKNKAVPRVVPLDTVYQSRDVSRIIRKVMKGGKMSVAETLVYTAIDKVKKTTEQDPMSVLDKAIKNITPELKYEYNLY